MRTSQKGKDLIRQFEDRAGFERGACSHCDAYQDAGGVWTVGWGTTHGVMAGVKITPAMADDLLDAHLAKLERELEEVFAGVELTQGQWDALVSLTYNLKGGPRALAKTAPKLVAAIRERRRLDAAREFLDINKAEGKPLAGLTRPRQAEAKLFLETEEAV